MMSTFDSLFPIPSGGRNADDMGMPPALPVRPQKRLYVVRVVREAYVLAEDEAEAAEMKGETAADYQRRGR